MAPRTGRSLADAGGRTNCRRCFKVLKIWEVEHRSGCPLTNQCRQLIGEQLNTRQATHVATKSLRQLTNEAQPNQAASTLGLRHASVSSFQNLMARSIGPHQCGTQLRPVALTLHPVGRPAASQIVEGSCGQKFREPCQPAGWPQNRRRTWVHEECNGDPQFSSLINETGSENLRQLMGSQLVYQKTHIDGRQDPIAPHKTCCHSFDQWLQADWVRMPQAAYQWRRQQLAIECLAGQMGPAPNDGLQPQLVIRRNAALALPPEDQWPPCMHGRGQFESPATPLEQIKLQSTPWCQPICPNT